MSRMFAASLLLSMLTLSAAAKASTPADDATAPTPVRVSTGVTAPVMLGTPVLTMPAGLSMELLPEGAKVGLALTINEKGEPENIQVVKSYSPFVDGRVVETVSQMHFRPGKIDNQPTAVDMNLVVNVTR